MRVKQLLEVKAPDFSPLAKIWNGNVFRAVYDALAHMKDDDSTLLLRIITKAQAAHADSSPEKLLSFIAPLLDIVEQGSRTNEPFAQVYHLSTELQELINRVVAVLLDMDPLPSKQLKSLESIPLLLKFLKPKLSVRLELAMNKHGRNNQAKKFDNENEVFVFIGRPAFREVPPGSGNFQKTLEIENLLKIDRHDADAHKMAGIMKIRARVQGENSEVYSVTLPAGVFTEKSTTQIDPWMVDLIDKHKTKVS